MGVDEPLMTFSSHVVGKNAVVSIYPDRLEWVRKSRVRGTATETIRLRSVTSISTKRQGFVYHMLMVSTVGGHLIVRCSKADAQKARALLEDLMMSKS